MKRAFPLLVAACGSTAAPPTPAPAPAPVAPEPPATRPSPGLDIDGPLAIPDRTPAPRKPAVPFDLASDRAIVEVHVPVPPRGGAVGFTFADDRPGWVTRIPDAQQLPSVAYGHDRVYVSGGFQSVSFYALEATTGRIAWATTNLEDNGPTAAVVEGDDVLFNTESCTLFALDAKTGKRRWFRYLGDPTLTQVAATDGLVYAAHPDKDSGGRRLSAFRVTSGAPVWSRTVDGELLATPVIAGDAVYASTLTGTTYRFDHRTGKLRWARALRATTAPWIVGDELFVTRRKGGKEQQVVVSVDTGKILREHRMSSGSYAWDVPGPTATTPETVWAFEGSRPVVDRGIHYVAMANEVIASDAKSGEAIWDRRYPTKSRGRTLGSVALAGSTIVVSSRDGKVFGLDVDTGYTLWSYDIGHQVVAEPIVAKGWLYSTTTDGYVIALDVADKSLDGWHMFGGNAHKNGSAAPPPVAPPPIEGRPTSAATAPPAPVDPVAIAQTRLDQIVADEQASARIDRAVDDVYDDPPEIAPKDRKPFTLDPACLDHVLCK